MVNAIVGYTGFVGSNLLQYYNFDEFYNSKNFEDARGKHFDLLFFSGVPAVKWYANKYPDEDADNLSKIKDVLGTISAKRIILISTIDVYDNINNNSNESTVINYTDNHTYGKNRYIFEEYVKNHFEKYHIVRLPGLFGKGLKKNIIYDLINDNQVDNISLDTSFQWYYLDWLKNDIDVVLKNDLRVCNFFTEPISTRDIVSEFERVYKDNTTFKIDYLGKNKSTARYDCCTEYGKLFNQEISYIKDKRTVLEGLNHYLNYTKIDKNQLSISNICINNIAKTQFYSLVKLFGINKLQVAPTTVVSGWNLLNEMLLRESFENIKINSFQSITYTLLDNIFSPDTRDNLLDHIKSVIDYGEEIGLSFLVFGCPKNRKVEDSSIDNEKIFVEFFKELSDYMKGKKLIICIENNSKQYGCNFINLISECEKIVKLINSPNIKMMVDIGNAIMEKDEWYRFSNIKSHVFNIDVSNPNMNSFEDCKEEHQLFSYLLKQNNYTNNINLEMLNRTEDKADELEKLVKSLTNFVNVYGK